MKIIQQQKINIEGISYLFALYQLNSNKKFKLLLTSLQKPGVKGQKHYFLYETISYLLALELFYNKTSFETYVQVQNVPKCTLKNMLIPYGN